MQDTSRMDIKGNVCSFVRSSMRNAPKMPFFVCLEKTESLLPGGNGVRLLFPPFHLGRDGTWTRSG